MSLNPWETILFCTSVVGSDDAFDETQSTFCGDSLQESDRPNRTTDILLFLVSDVMFLSYLPLKSVFTLKRWRWMELSLSCW